jgi:hypothetical protein
VVFCTSTIQFVNGAYTHTHTHTHTKPIPCLKPLFIYPDDGPHMVETCSVVNGSKIKHCTISVVSDGMINSLIMTWFILLLHYVCSLGRLGQVLVHFIPVLTWSGWVKPHGSLDLPISEQSFEPMLPARLFRKRYFLRTDISGYFQGKISNAGFNPLPRSCVFPCFIRTPR